MDKGELRNSLPAEPALTQPEPQNRLERVRERSSQSGLRRPACPPWGPSQESKVVVQWLPFAAAVGQAPGHVQLFATPRTTARQASLSLIVSQSLPKFMSLQVIPSSHLILCHPLLLLPSHFSSFRVFSSESVLCIRWTKCWSFSFGISP